MWRLEVQDLPEGYQVLEWEDGLMLVDPEGRVIAEYGPMLSDTRAVVRAAWADAGRQAEGSSKPVI